MTLSEGWIFSEQVYPQSKTHVNFMRAHRTKIDVKQRLRTTKKPPTAGVHKAPPESFFRHRRRPVPASDYRLTRRASAVLSGSPAGSPPFHYLNRLFLLQIEKIIIRGRRRGWRRRRRDARCDRRARVCVCVMPLSDP